MSEPTQEAIREEMRLLVGRLANMMLALDTPQMTYIAKVSGGNFDGQTIGVALIFGDPELEAERDDELS
jgi:hypothetical protein